MRASRIPICVTGHTIPQITVYQEKFNTVNLQQEIAKGMQQIMVFDKPDSSNSFYIKRKDGKGYDLYVKHEDAFINTGIIENPEDYKSPKIYSSKKEATKFYENIK